MIKKKFLFLALIFLISLVSSLTNLSMSEYSCNDSGTFDIINCYYGNDTDWDTFAYQNNSGGNSYIYVNFTDNYTAENSVYVKFKINVSYFSESSSYYPKVYCWNEAGLDWYEFHSFSEVGVVTYDEMIWTGCGSAPGTDNKTMFRFVLSTDGNEPCYFYEIESYREDFFDDSLGGGSSPPDPEINNQTFLGVFKGGGSPSELASAWNPSVYPLLKVSFSSIFEPNTFKELPSKIWDFVFLFIKFVFRQQASLVDLGDIQ